MKYPSIFEAELINKVAADFFANYDSTEIKGRIDFAVKVKRPANAIDFYDEYLLWAEAKQRPTDILAMLAQLVLTIGKARTFDKDDMLPPKFLGCFDCEKIAFVPYHDIQHIFYQTDFNWNVTSSNHDTKEFQQIYSQIDRIINHNSPFNNFLFDFEKDEKELRRFIRENFIVGKGDTTKIKIDKNNFIIIYNKWLEMVKPTIEVDDWQAAKKDGIIDGDFYLADLLSSENETLKEKLFVLLHSNYYEADKHKNKYGFFTSSKIYFTDNQKKYNTFWAKYERPPLEEYWDYIVDHRNLLVPQDIRERKGSFYTPRIWVELSQRYLAEVLGKDWQDEYYVWDCCAGTGNLLAGLTNKYKIWASTLDRQDVDVMRDRIENGANLLEEHVFQFDFLNDDFVPKSKGGKLPDELYKIISDENRRKHLVIYINPPYADASSGRRANAKAGNSFTKIHGKYNEQLGNFVRELFAQFLIRIYFEIPDCKIGEFSKLKLLTDTHAEKMRTCFLSKLEKAFIIPADTFDNVNGKFPIGFFIWDTAKKLKIQKSKVDIFDASGKKLGKKDIISYKNREKINRWITEKRETCNGLGYISLGRNDLQHTDLAFIINEKSLATNYNCLININNLIQISVYFSVQKVIKPTWLNDRDQFLYPNKKWERDLEFQNDCLAYTLFNNNVSVKYGVNHWIPFAESEVDARTEFESHFMISFLSGKIVQNAYTGLFEHLEQRAAYNWQKGQKREFSPEAQAVFAAGRDVWKYYHSQKNINVNAALYDIREHFQGRGGNGKMNSNSTDQQYNELMGILRQATQLLAQKIEPKVYEYGFLME